MSRSSLASVVVFLALSLGLNAKAQSLPVQTGSPPSPPSSFTLGPRAGGLSLSDIAALTANCNAPQGLSAVIRCRPYQVRTFAPAPPPVLSEHPFQLNPSQWSSKDWQDSGRNLATTSFSLHVAGNLATEDSTRMFLKGLGGEALAATAPEVFEMIKSPAARYAALAGVVIGGTVYLYEGLWGGGTAKNEQSSSAPQSRTFRLLGTVSPAAPLAPNH